MIARLVENWLDNASERSFQAAFCQMLLAKGFRVLHSTRHASVEFGKDVVAIDAEGRPCAYQLKGNPGSRLTLDQFRKIETQLHEMAVYALTGPGVPDGPHRAFLVTNGLVEEETRLAIEKLNAGYKAEGLSAKLEIIQRGDLLKDALDLGEALWPSELADVHTLLELLVIDGRELYPLSKSHRLLSAILVLDESKPVTASDLRRRITSAGVFTAVSLKAFDGAGNHYAAIQAWGMFAGYVIAACHKHGVSFNEAARESIDVATAVIVERMVLLVDEAVNHDTLAEGNLLVDSVAYGARYLLLLGLASALWLWAERRGWPKMLDRDRVRAFLLGRKTRVDLWGEGALPQLLAFYWFLRTQIETVAAEGVLLSAITAIAGNVQREGGGLPSPYWTFDDVARHRMVPLLGDQGDPMRKETIGRSSYFLEGLFLLLVRTNRKQACRSLWPDVSRINFQAFDVSSPWAFPLWRTDQGVPTTVVPPLTVTWSDLVASARVVDCPALPRELVDRPFLLLLLTIMFPFRATTAVIGRLGYEFDDGWYIPDAIGRGRTEW